MVEKRLVKFCHPLQVANFVMLLVQNSLRYVSFIPLTAFYEYFCSTQVCFKDLKIKSILLNFKHGVQRSHSQACTLKKMHTTLYLFCFQMSCVVFWNQKSVIRKKV